MLRQQWGIGRDNGQSVRLSDLHCEQIGQVPRVEDGNLNLNSAGSTIAPIT